MSIWDIKEFNSLLESCKATSKSDIKIALNKINEKYNYWVYMESLLGLVTECMDKAFDNKTIDEDKVFNDIKHSLSSTLDEINKVENPNLPF